MKNALLFAVAVSLLSGCMKSESTDTVTITIWEGHTVSRRDGIVEIRAATPMSPEVASRIRSAQELADELGLTAKQVAYLWPEGLHAFSGRVEVESGGRIDSFELAGGSAKRTQ